MAQSCRENYHEALTMPWLSFFLGILSLVQDDPGSSDIFLCLIYATVQLITANDTVGTAHNPPPSTGVLLMDIVLRTESEGQ